MNTQNVILEDITLSYSVSRWGVPTGAWDRLGGGELDLRAAESSGQHRAKLWDGAVKQSMPP